MGPYVIGSFCAGLLCDGSFCDGPFTDGTLCRGTPYIYCIVTIIRHTTIYRLASARNIRISPGFPLLTPP
jgi:hypothetical protein